jgi:hypothetical protein
MKNAMIAGVMTATILIAGCGKKSAGSATAPPPGGKPVAISDGTNVWQLGDTIINGTNVSTNVTVRIRTREASK